MLYALDNKPFCIFNAETIIATVTPFVTPAYCSATLWEHNNLFMPKCNIGRTR